MRYAHATRTAVSSQPSAYFIQSTSSSDAVSQRGGRGATRGEFNSPTENAPLRSWGGRGATRGEFNYGSSAPLRSWGGSADLRGFPP
ncbi:hypothetical protein [Moorena sp. SIO2C4]|uniref:hypothetical protein n=1 Tax=Moorena sp. SIO2C4 TaxID=2607824 RepID=UPI00257DE89D|nr:hypothetical protein [Moorena sp. SIO2C4]